VAVGVAVGVVLSTVMGWGSGLTPELNRLGKNIM